MNSLLTAIRFEPMTAWYDVTAVLSRHYCTSIFTPILSKKIFLYFFFDAFILSGDKTKNHYFLEQFFLSQYLWEPPPAAAAGAAAVFINNVSAIVIVQPNRAQARLPS